MATVTIDSVNYFSYISAAAAISYLAADSGAANWRAADTDVQARALVSATRWLDRLSWSGDKTDDDQDNAWPRDGITGVEDDETPQAVIDACALLASAIVDGLNANTNTAAGGGTKRLKADTVEIEYFRPTDEAVLPLPLSIWQLIAAYLGGAGSTIIGGSESTGTDGCYPFSDGWGFTSAI